MPMTVSRATMRTGATLASSNEFRRAIRRHLARNACRTPSGGFCVVGRVGYAATELLRKIRSQMGKKRHAARQALPATADLLIAEIVAEKWGHLQPPPSSIPVEEWDEVIREFSQRCPGFHRDDYVEALRRSQFNNR